MARIVIIQGHPYPEGGHFGHALAEAYVRGARAGGHGVRQFAVARADFSWIRNRREWTEQPVPASLRSVQRAIGRADHLVLFFPLWLGTMPAVLKAFLEQILRPGFALIYEGNRFPQNGFRGKSARVVATTALPVFWHRWFFGRGAGGLDHGILAFCGVRPVRGTLVGAVDSRQGGRRTQWLRRVETLGRAAE
ncbi:MAG TPA: NAD(P)H-dependent oxidoreductase [Candidatus Didemnitutus sp.]|nr:NAD(P)H-dependent oxidoreductase [Candidatus Didemnitutus sp.]